MADKELVSGKRVVLRTPDTSSMTKSAGPGTSPPTTTPASVGLLEMDEKGEYTIDND